MKHAGGPTKTRPLCARHPDDFQLHTGDDENDTADKASINNLLTPPAQLAAYHRAIETCETCAIIDPATFTACAKAALAAGTTIDGELEACADGVVQAGVECRGDRRTWRELKTAAGETVDPARCAICGRSFHTDVIERGDGICAGCTQVTTRHLVVAPSTPRNTPPDECLSCGKPMATGPGPHPDGVVRHAARGQCRSCNNRAERGAA